MAISQAESVSPIDPTGWVESYRCVVLRRSEPHVAIPIGRNDRDEYNEYYYTSSKPAEFELDIRDVDIGGGVVLRRDEPLLLRASLCDTDGCYRANVPGVGLPLSAFSREEMIEALSDLLALLWEEYAQEEDVNLTVRAQRVKASLLRDYTVVR